MLVSTGVHCKCLKVCECLMFMKFHWCRFERGLLIDDRPVFWVSSWPAGCQWLHGWSMTENQPGTHEVSTCSKILRGLYIVALIFLHSSFYWRFKHFSPLDFWLPGLLQKVGAFGGLWLFESCAAPRGELGRVSVTEWVGLKVGPWVNNLIVLYCFWVVCCKLYFNCSWL